MIKATLIDFINCWKMFNGKGMMTEQDAAGAINRGDCGMAAIGVAYVLRHKYNQEVQIRQNANHCWLMVPGCGEFDTLHVDGYKTPVKEVWDRLGGSVEKTSHFGEACTEWMPCDAHGGYLLKAFFDRHSLPMPVELQHLITNAAEYECPEQVPVLQGYYERTLRVPFPV